MQSEYKLHEVKDKFCHFSRVTVQAELQLSGVEVTDDIREPLDRSQGEVSRKGYSDWIEAALQGAQFCAQALVEQGQIAGCRVTIVRVVGTDCDTIAHDVFCASALATYQVLRPNVALQAFDFGDGKWHIEFN